MPIETRTVRFGEGQIHSGLLALPPHAPEALPLPSVVLIQEIWGVDGHIRDVAHRLAAVGYAVLAPDLFSENGERRQGLEEDRVEEAKLWLNTQPQGVWMDPEARRKALAAEDGAKAARVNATLDALFGGLQSSWGYFAAASAAAAAWLRTEGEATKGGKVAAVGFCMGGTLAGGLALRPGALDGSVVFYGQAPAPDQAAKLACPVLALYGAEDGERTNGGAKPFAEAAAKAGKSFEPHFLKGAAHAFLNDTRSSYRPGAAREAWALLLGFLHQRLG